MGVSFAGAGVDTAGVGFAGVELAGVGAAGVIGRPAGGHNTPPHGHGHGPGTTRSAECARPLRPPPLPSPPCAQLLGILLKVRLRRCADPPVATSETNISIIDVCILIMIMIGNRKIQRKKQILLCPVFVQVARC